MRGSGDERDFLLNGYMKQLTDHKGSKVGYELLLSHLQEQKISQSVNSIPYKNKGITNIKPNILMKNFLEYTEVCV